MTSLIIIIIVLALIFDYINGFHDAANSIATIVSTKVLTPFQAVIWAALFNFAAFFIFKDHGVANTVAKTVKPEVVAGSIGLVVVLAGLVAAISWNLFTWWFGIPSSSSHTLIGGFAGAGMAKAVSMGSAAMSAINLAPILKVVAFIVLAPVIGMIISVIISIIILHISKNARPSVAEKWFKRLQLISSAALSFTHGGNDAQKVMGIIYVAMVAANVLKTGDAMPEWVPISCYAAIALGTMSGGWKIVKTMGSKITKVNAFEGVAAESAGAVTLGITEHFGIPVSTTHTITGSIVGVGLLKRVSAVRWGVTVSLLWAWVLTIPVSATLAAIVFSVIHLFF